MNFGWWPRGELVKHRGVVHRVGVLVKGVKGDRWADGEGGLGASKGFWVLASRLKVIPVNGERSRGISFTIVTPMRFVLWQCLL